MNKVVRKRIVSATLVLVVFAAIQWWQTRSMPRGAAPTFVTIDLQTGVQKTLPSGGKDVEILYFFAPWCGVCELSSKNAEHVAQWMPGAHVTFVGLDYEDPAEVTRFVSDNKLTSNVVLADRNAQQAWHIDGYPTYAVINNRGEISSMAVGYSTTIGTYLRVLLAKIGV